MGGRLTSESDSKAHMSAAFARIRRHIGVTCRSILHNLCECGERNVSVSGQGELIGTQ
jgi:hypothetical protein